MQWRCVVRYLSYLADRWEIKQWDSRGAAERTTWWETDRTPTARSPSSTWTLPPDWWSLQTRVRVRLTLCVHMFTNQVHQWIQNKILVIWLLIYRNQEQIQLSFCLSVRLQTEITTQPASGIRIRDQALLESNIYTSILLKYCTTILWYFYLLFTPLHSDSWLDFMLRSLEMGITTTTTTWLWQKVVAVGVFFRDFCWCF